MEDQVICQIERSRQLVRTLNSVYKYPIYVCPKFLIRDEAFSITEFRFNYSKPVTILQAIIEINQRVHALITIPKRYRSVIHSDLVDSYFPGTMKASVHDIQQDPEKPLKKVLWKLKVTWSATGLDILDKPDRNLN